MFITCSLDPRRETWFYDPGYIILSSLYDHVMMNYSCSIVLVYVLEIFQSRSFVGNLTKNMQPVLNLPTCRLNYQHLLIKWEFVVLNHTVLGNQRTN